MTISGSDLIRIERLRQVTSEAYKPAGDVGHADALVSAATAYSINSLFLLVPGEADGYSADTPLAPWPWAAEFWKPTGDPVRDLVKAGALIAAALDALIAEHEAATVIAPASGLKR